MDKLDKAAWGTDSGLLDAFDFTAEETWFGSNPESDFPDVVYLFMRGPAIIDEEMVDEEYVIRFSTGKNWEVIDSGEGVENATGSIRFQSRSGMGELVTAIVGTKTVEGLIDKYPALEEALADRGNPTEAATFKGLGFSFERVEHSFKDRDTQEDRTYSRLVPIAFLETKGKGKAKAKGKTKADAAPSNAAVKRAVKKFAADFEENEFDDFVDAVLDVDEFPQAEEISAEVKEWILDKDEGLWSDLHG